MPIDTPDAFEAFYTRTVVDLTAFVRRRAHEVQVEDVVAEVYATAWRRRADVPTGSDPRASPPPGDPATAHDPARAWLFGVARNHLMATSRGGRRRTALEVRLAPRAEPTAPDPATGVGDRDDLRRAWATLLPAEQEVLAVHLLEELDSTAAAHVLGCSRAAYSMRLSRARRRLSRALGAAPAPAQPGPVHPPGAPRRPAAPACPPAAPASHL